MNFYSIIISFCDLQIISTFIFVLIICKLLEIYVRRRRLPPGPLPLPIIGNILIFRTKHHWIKTMEQLTEKYSPAYTLWFGHKPIVFITDPDIGRDSFMKNQFSGRGKSYFGTIITKDYKYSDVFFADYGPAWESLRKVSHSAIVKLSTSDKLIYSVSDCVDYIFELILKKEGLNKAFCPFEYIYHLFLSILSSNALGKKYEIDDNEYKIMKYIMRDFLKEAGSRFLLWQFSPIFRFIDRKVVKKHEQLWREGIEKMKIEFQSHYEDYDENNIRDFCDALIYAKNDALKEGKETALYLTDENLCRSVCDLFLAGTDSSQNTFKWVLLFMLYHPNEEKKLRHEIEREIGDRLATHEDRERCHYLMAFISESLRYSNLSPFAIPHKATKGSKIGDLILSEDTEVCVIQNSKNEKFWSNANEFRPQRFLENDIYMTTRPKAYMPFGVGRRICLGEKLAIADIFLVLVRFLQKTTNYELSLHNSNGLDPDPNITDTINPNYYEIIIKTKVH